MYVSTADSRKGFPDLGHPRVELHITNAHEPTRGRVRVHITLFSVRGRHTYCTLPAFAERGGPGEGPYYAAYGTEGNITNAHEPARGRVRVHITPFSVLKETGALDQGHI